LLADFMICGDLSGIRPLYRKAVNSFLRTAHRRCAPA
jgi:hypothetical protein